MKKSEFALMFLKCNILWLKSSSLPSTVLKELSEVGCQRAWKLLPWRRNCSVVSTPFAEGRQRTLCAVSPGVAARDFFSWTAYKWHSTFFSLTCTCFPGHLNWAVIASRGACTWFTLAFMCNKTRKWEHRFLCSVGRKCQLNTG